MIKRYNQYLLKTERPIFFSYILFFSCYLIYTLISSLMKINPNEKDLVSAISLAFPIHTFFISFTILLGTLTLFTRNVKVWMIFLITIISIDGSLYYFLSSDLHPILVDLGVFSYIQSLGRTHVNPQYTILLTFSIVLIGNCILLFSNKSIDRVFIFFIMISVVCTTLLFHRLIPMGYFQLSKTEETISLEREIMLIDGVKERCDRLNLECYTLSTKDVYTITPSDRLHNIKPAILYSIDRSKNITTYISNSSNLRFDYAIVYIENRGDVLHVYIDENRLAIHSRMSEAVFMILASFAHTIWVFGGLFILYMHKFYFLRRNRLNVSRET